MSIEIITLIIFSFIGWTLYLRTSFKYDRLRLDYKYVVENYTVLSEYYVKATTDTKDILLLIREDTDTVIIKDRMENLDKMIEHCEDLIANYEIKKMLNPKRMVNIVIGEDKNARRTK